MRRWVEVLLLLLAAAADATNITMRGNRLHIQGVGVVVGTPETPCAEGYVLYVHATYGVSSAYEADDSALSLRTRAYYDIMEGLHVDASVGATGIVVNDDGNGVFSLTYINTANAAETRYPFMSVACTTSVACDGGCDVGEHRLGDWDTSFDLDPLDTTAGECADLHYAHIDSLGDCTTAGLELDFLPLVCLDDSYDY